MPVWTWVCLGVFLAVTLPTLLLALAAVFGMFRRLRGSSLALEPGVEYLADSTERLALTTERTAEGVARAEESVLRLSASRRKLDVLLWALQDVRRLVHIALVVVPRK